MALGRLVSIPLQQLEAIFSESWSALRRTSRYRDVPALEPSLGLIGEALLDRTFTNFTSVMTGVPLPETVRRMLADITEARDFYDRQGWLANPKGYHRDPPPAAEVEIRKGSAWSGPRRLRFQGLRFESGWEPHPGEPGRERWLAHPVNGTAHAYVLEHPEPRPWLVCVHGFGMGSPMVNFSAFQSVLLHRRLGLNVIFPVLPLHGPRGVGRFSGSEVFNPDYMRMVHLFAQAAWDVRRVISWVRARGAEQVGLYGISLGGYVAALVASLEDGLDCAIAGIPAVDFPNLARDNEPWVMRRYDDEFDLDWRLIRAISHVVSPLAFTPRVPREKCFIYAGIADRVVRPDQPRALWRHWGYPEIHWFSGGHVLGIFNASVAPFIERCLIDAGMARAA
jgi:pimeloyl-ACP methyl ester carboxylesterase